VPTSAPVSPRDDHEDRPDQEHGQTVARTRPAPAHRVSSLAHTLFVGASLAGSPILAPHCLGVEHADPHGGHGVTADIIRRVEPRRRWHVVMPVKGGPHAKSRLGAVTADRAGIALSMALDCMEAVLATPGVDRVLVVTDDPLSVQESRDLGADVLTPSSADGGLNAAVGEGVAACPPGAAVAVLLADIPALRPEDLRAGLDAVETALESGAGWAFVPDAEGTGTVLVAAEPASRIVAAFGPGSADAYERFGARRLDVAVDRLRRDVDTATSLTEALRLGAGPRTRRSLGVVQATVLTYDATTREGTVVTDDGVRLAMPATSLERSGLRHLRPGQRVTCAREGDTVTDVHIVGISG